MILRKKIIFGVLFALLALLGITPLVNGLYTFYNAYIVSRDTIETQAIVTAVERGVRCKTDKAIPTDNCINITYTYTTSNGEQFTDTDYHISPIKDENKDYDIGDTLLVKYSESNPHLNVSGYTPLGFDYFFGIVLTSIGIWILVATFSNFKEMFGK